MSVDSQSKTKCISKGSDYAQLWQELTEQYRRQFPKSAQLQESALRYLVDGGSHGLRLMKPFPLRTRTASGAYLKDEDGHQILDFWQGHYANLLGHNPEVVTEKLTGIFEEGQGLQTGMTERYQPELAELICQQTGAERIRFTTSGSLATKYAMMLARCYTGRELILKVGGGWHGGQPWGLKGAGFSEGFDKLDSQGLPESVDREVLITGFNHLQKLEDDFGKYGDRLACFIVEPVIGAGGMIPALREYIQLARTLCDRYGVALIFDEVISGFRFCAGTVATIYGVQPDLTALGKVIGGGMPVAAVAGRAEIVDLIGRSEGTKVKFGGGTYSGHPASMLAGLTFLRHLVEHEKEIYPELDRKSRLLRKTVNKAFEDLGIYVRFAGDRSDMLPDSSLHMLLFPYEKENALLTPEEVRNPAISDLDLSERIFQLAMLLEGVHTIHGMGATVSAHSEEDMQLLGEACSRVGERMLPFLV